MIISISAWYGGRLFKIEQGKPNKIVTAFRKYIVLPATFGGKHAEPNRFCGLDFNITPLRWMTLLQILYGVLNIIFLWPQVDVFEENSKLGTPAAQWARYIGDRSGIFCTVMIPSLYAFAGRNNILSYISGWSMATFNVIHRWTGRWMFIQAVIHSITYSLVYIYDGGRASYIEKIWDRISIVWGTVATILAGVILVQSAYPLRHYFYEIFHIFHIALAAVFIPYTYLHIYEYDYYQWYYWKYMWACVGIWVGDHVLRICRILYSGLFVTAKTQVFGGSLLMRVKPMIKWPIRPGQYAYLYIMKYKIWESHPFTLLGVRDGEYYFIMKANAGMTRTIYDRVNRQQGQSKTMNVWVEGFYGETFPIFRFNTIVLVAGGVGITPILNYATEIARKGRDGQTVIIHWSTRDDELIPAVKPFLDDVLASGKIEVHIHVTGPQNGDFGYGSSSEKPSSVSDMEEGEKSNSLSDASVTHTSGALKVLDLQYGKRPQFDEILSNIIHEAPSSVGIFVCAPGAMSDVCRKSVTENLDKGNGRVELFEEEFAWA
ncbi:ferric reductase NAD binding domain-containing protein [Lipomyces oligophaga]|uniref:ferric reductase NAD binding domain-containing protein n=1 Tax=Lipomyces oligophaga TaxID=45792 RepID=UPI0034CEDA46